MTGALALVQGRADARLPAPPLKLRGDDLGVVEHEDIAGPQQARQIEHLPIRDVGPLDQQQPRAVAWARGPKRNPVRGKLEIEKVDAMNRGRSM